MSAVNVVRIVVNGHGTFVTLDKRKNLRTLMASAIASAGFVGDAAEWELRDKHGVHFDRGVRVSEYVDALEEGQPLYLSPKVGVGA